MAEEELELEEELEVPSGLTDLDRAEVEALQLHLSQRVYAEDQGPRVLGQLWSPDQLLSVAIKELGLNTPDKAGWSERDKNNVAIAVDKLKKWKTLPQDTTRYNELLERGEERTAEAERTYQALTEAWQTPDLTGAQAVMGQAAAAVRAKEDAELWRIEATREAYAALAGWGETPNLEREFFAKRDPAKSWTAPFMASLHEALMLAEGFSKITEEGYETPREKEDPSFQETNRGWSFLRLLGPRTASPEQAKFLFKTTGLPVSNVWMVDWQNPSSGLLVEMEDGEVFHYDAPEIDTEDILEFIGTEFLPLAADLLLTRGATKMFSTFLKGDFPSVWRAMGRGAMIGTASGVGTGFGEAVRLGLGKALGAHDMDWDEAGLSILKEAGLASLGATGMLGVFKGIGLARRLFSAEPPTGWYAQLAPAIRLWEKETGKKWQWGGLASKHFPDYKPDSSIHDFLTEHHDVSMKAINEAMEALGMTRATTAPKVGKGPFGRKSTDPYVTTIARAEGDINALRAEEELLRLAAENPAIGAVVEASMAYNDKVAREMLLRMHSFNIDKNVNAADLAKQIADEMGVRLNKELEPLLGVGKTIQRGVQERVAELGEPYAGYDPTLKSVWGRRRMPGMFKGLRAPIQKLAQDIIAVPRKQFQEALNRPDYQDLRIPFSPATKKQFKRWLKITPQKEGDIFVNPLLKEAKEQIYQLVPMSKGAQEGLDSTLALMAGKKLKDVPPLPPRSLNELNEMREILNHMMGTDILRQNNELASLVGGARDAIGKDIDNLFRETASLQNGLRPASAENTKWMENNNWGVDLKRAWQAQAEAIEVSQFSIIAGLTQGEPSKLMDYFLRKYSNSGNALQPDLQLQGLVNTLETLGKHDMLRDIRGTVIDYIDRTIMDPDLSLVQRNKQYQEFLQDHRPFLMGLFPPKEFGKISTLPNFLKGAVARVEEAGVLVEELHRVYGEKATVTNLVTDFLNKQPDIQGGEWLQQVDEFLDLIKDSPEMKEQTKQVALNWILFDKNLGFLRARANGDLYIDDRRLNDLLSGFRPGPETTHKFENYFGRFLGEEGIEYVKNLRLLNSMVQREVTTSLPGRKALEAAGEPVAYEPQTRFIERMIIAPLTRTGRRITAGRGLLKRRAQLASINALLNPRKLSKLMRRKNMQLTEGQLASALTAWYMFHNRDVGGEFEDTPVLDWAYDSIKDFTAAPLDKISNALSETWDVVGPALVPVKELEPLPRTGTDNG